MDSVLAAWQRFVAGITHDSPLRTVILDSWTRSRDAGVSADPEQVRPPRVNDRDLERRLATADDLLKVARPHMEWVSLNLSNVPHVIYLTDRDGIVLLALGDRQQIEVFGLEPGHDWSERAMGTNGAGTALVTNQPVAIVGPEHFSNAFHNCTCTAAPLHAPDGTVIGALDISSSVVDGSPDRLILVAHIATVIDRELALLNEIGAHEEYRHLSEQVRIQGDLLQETNRRLNAILDNTTAFIYLMDTRDRFVHINRRWTTTFGLTNEDVAGQSVYRFFPKPTADQFAANNQKVREARIPLEFEETAEYGGQLRTYLTIKVPVLDPEGKIEAICGISSDITDRKLAEQKLLEADQRKDEFLAVLGHELRNPLSPLRSGLDLLDRHGADAQIVSLMRQQVGYVVRLVDDLLDVSRIVQGKVNIRKRPVCLPEVLQQAVETEKPAIEKHQHAFDASWPDEPIWLMADDVRLIQVFTNLLHNAVKYTEPGGHITLSAERSGDDVLIRISDNGTGMDAELIGRAFELFTQDARSIGRSQGGLGIGLPLVKNLVEMHGGSVEAHSAGRGLGTTFTVRLPMLTGPCTTASDGLDESRPVPARRVLIVEDNVASARLLGMLLEKTGNHDVRLAHTGEDAIAAALEFEPEVILSDIGLPTFDGYELAQRLRQDARFSDTLLVALTGYAGDRDRERCIEAGFNGHLVKPPDMRVLDRLLTDLCPPA